MSTEHKEKHNIAEENTARVFECGGITRFKDRLREAMGGESGNSFAKRCGMSEAVIRAYLSGKTYPSLDRLAVLAEKCEVSIEWLANGGSMNDKDMSSPSNKSGLDESQSKAEAQQQAWIEFFNRMTPSEREAIIDKVYRHGIDVLLTSIQTASTPTKSQFPWPDDFPEKTGISHNAMVMALRYDSMTDQERLELLADIEKAHSSASGHKPSDKQAG